MDFAQRTGGLRSGLRASRKCAQKSCANGGAACDETGKARGLESARA
jgi:hypothetical protein